MAWANLTFDNRVAGATYPVGLVRRAINASRTGALLTRELVCYVDAATSSTGTAAVDGFLKQLSVRDPQVKLPDGTGPVVYFGDWTVGAIRLTDLETGCTRLELTLTQDIATP